MYNMLVHYIMSPQSLLLYVLIFNVPVVLATLTENTHLNQEKFVLYLISTLCPPIAMH